MNRIIHLSDTHNYHEKISIPDGDILIHTGDCSMRGGMVEVNYFLAWFGSLPHKTKIFVAGNHDFLFEQNPTYCKTLCEQNGIIWLNDQSYEYQDIHFYGSSAQPNFCNWAFNLPRNGKELKRKWGNIPDNTNILLVHSPPYGILDRCPDHGASFCGTPMTPKLISVGCEAMKAEIDSGRLKELKLCMFGHIHENYGRIKKNQIEFLNSSILDEDYTIKNLPQIVDYE